ncbi:MAG TPA: substrate-binding domain-containing protein [Pseudonocardia sp.]|nr:substrate-binding domain-containing protein [Pseudonocardia sp.]
MRRHLSLRRLAVFGGTTVVTLLTALGTGVPATALQWVALGLGALLAGLLAAMLVPLPEQDEPPEPADDGAAEDGPADDDENRLGRWRRRLRARWKLTTAVVAALGLLVTLGALEVLRGATDCPPTTQLRLVTDPETLTTARRLAAAYVRATAADHDGCPTAQIYTYAPSDAATIRIRLQPNDGWSDNYGALSRVGPRPDIWLASTGHQVDLVNADQAEPSVIERSTTIARSPTVLAVPGPADQKPRTWSELLTRFTGPTPRLVRGNPTTDDLDMLATVGLYESSPDDGAAATPPVEIERRIQTAVEAGSFPVLGDAADLLCHRRQLMATGSAPPGALDTAVVATEQQLIRYNVGEPLGGSCGTGSAALPADLQLHAVYPSDTVDQDLQFAQLRWSSREQKDTAADFLRWLGRDPGRQAIVRTGLRPIADSFTPLEPLTTGSGIDPIRSPPSGPVSAARWQTANEQREKARRPSDLLFAVDSSGSMATAGANGSRQQLAAAAILSGLTRLGPLDGFGLWSFPDAAGTGHVEAMPIGGRDEARLAAADQALAKIKPAGNTPLFRTIVDGSEALARAPGTDDDLRALVVLTDGEDTTSGISAAEAVQAAASRQVRIVVITVGDIRCSNPTLITITTSPGNTCRDADPASLPDLVARVVAELKGGGR